MTSGNRAILWLAIAYSISHFVYSGIVVPLRTSSLRQIKGEMRPVAAHMAGAAVVIDNPRQYGPTFFFVTDPILRFAGGDPDRLARAFYALELTVLTAALLLTLLGLSTWFAHVRPDAAKGAFTPIAIGITLLWLNFSPLLYVLGVRGVEGWELFLIAGALYALLNGRDFVAGACIGAATLTKMIPGLFLLYFAVKNRRALAAAVVTVAAMLSISHLLFGPAIGWQYPGLMLRASHGRTWALTYHENVSLKGMLVKAFGHLQTPTPDHVQLVDPDPETGYWVAIDDNRLAIANALGQAAQAVILLALVWILARGGERGGDPILRLVWDWSLVAAVMLVVSPQTAFEYMLLALGAFSFVLAAAIAQPGLMRQQRIFACALVAAVALVGNILPRQVINRIAPVAPLIAWSGYRHITLSEGYQYFGFPLAGMIALVIALWSLRPWASGNMTSA